MISPNKENTIINTTRPIKVSVPNIAQRPNINKNNISDVIPINNKHVVYCQAVEN